ncbi:MAG: hypothetical protein Q8P46_10530, partial [Hyphomicrobiales bacterium]|nr:hypothetical protein [Hyphomicrobiales bacterium]
MPRIARLSDGTQLRFPDGTADDVIDRAVKENLGLAGPAPKPAPAAPAVAPARVKLRAIPLDAPLDAPPEPPPTQEEIAAASEPYRALRPLRRETVAPTSNVPPKNAPLSREAGAPGVKGQGYFGPLKRPDGDISTELSFDFDEGGKKVYAPLLVPTLTKPEVDHLLSGGAPTDAHYQKAVEHARKRVAAGKDPFAGPGEQSAPPAAPSAPWTGEGGVLTNASAGMVAAVKSAFANVRSMGVEEEIAQRREALGIQPQPAEVGMAGPPTQAPTVIEQSNPLGYRIPKSAIQRQQRRLEESTAAGERVKAQIDQYKRETELVTPQNMDTAQQAVWSLVQSAPPTLLGIAVGILTRNPVAAMAIAGGGGGTFQAGSTYGEARDKGASHRLAGVAATIDAVLEGVGEALPLAIALRPGSPFLVRLANTMMAEGGQEAATQLAQDLNAFLTYNPDITLGEAWQNLKVATLAGVMGGAVYGGAGHLADRSGQTVALPAGGAIERQEPPQPSVVTTPSGPAPLAGTGPETLKAVLEDPRPAAKIAEDQAQQAAAVAAQQEAEIQAAQDHVQAETAAAAAPEVQPPAEAPIATAPSERVTVTWPGGETDVVIVLEDFGESKKVQFPDGQTAELGPDEGVTWGQGPEGENTPDKPVKAKSTQDVDLAATGIAATPSEAQKESGTYQKAHIDLQGLKISLENAKGSERSGLDSDGERWAVTMPAHYGYIKRTEGADGEQVDVYVGDVPGSQQVWVVDQIDPKTGNFDEHKVMLGFPTAVSALNAYRMGFSDGSGPSRLGWATHMSMDQFKEWLKNGNNKKAVAYVKPKAAPAPKLTEIPLTTTLDQGAPNARPVRSDQGKDDEKGDEGGRGAEPGGGDLQQPPSKPANVGPAPGGRPAQEPNAAPRPGDRPVPRPTEGQGPPVEQPAPLAKPKPGRTSFAITDDMVPPEVRGTGLESLTNIQLDKLAVEGNRSERHLASQERDRRRRAPEPEPTKAALIPTRTPGGGIEFVVQPLRPGAPAETKIVPETPKEAPIPPAAKPAYGDTNKTFTKDAAQAARERMRKKLGQVNVGIDPEMMQDGVTLAGYHIEAGARSFAQFTKAMIGDLGEAVRPYLKAWYSAIRNWPGFDNAGMQTEAEIEKEMQDEQLSDAAGRGDDKTAGEGVPGEGEPGRVPGADGTVTVAAGKPEDGGSPGEAGDTGGAGGGVRGTEAKAGEAVPSVGDVGAGLGGAGVGGNAAAGTGAAELAPVTAPKKNLANFHIADPERLIGAAGPKARFAKNRAAIDAYNAAISEHRDPTEVERETMAGYVGWGSFGQVLFEGSWERSYSPDAWKAEDKWLREHLGREEWESAQTSIINAHYTDPPTVTTIWDMVRAMGFKGGRVLEPSMGIGNFYGLMPRDLMEKSQLAGIEKDLLSGSMAQMMYPDANVQIKGYEESQTADNFYDLIIGNWPFAAQGPVDRRYAQLSAALHDYFFVKALDQVRPGGLVVGITSAGTMDKMGRNIRLELARKGELVASFRLPSGAFQNYAGTAVVTDLIILRKRDKPAADTLAAGWIESVKHEIGYNSINLNEYYEKNPENILGKLNWGHGTTSGRPGMIVDRQPDFPQQLATLPSRVPKGAFKTRKEARGIDYTANTTKERENTILVHPTSGELSVVRGEYLAPLDQIQKWKGKVASENNKREAEIKALIELRTAYSTLIKAETSGQGDIEVSREILRTRYQIYEKKYGRINRYGGAVTFFNKVRDPHTVRLMALESNKGDQKSPKWEPAKILFESTMRKAARIDNPSVADAFAIARNEGVDVDPVRIAELSKSTPEAIIKELEGLAAIWRTPAGTYEVTDVYLSGNVRRKLREAQAAAAEGQDMKRNIEALTKVLPETTPYYLIEAKLGAPWVGVQQYKTFVSELLGVTGTDGIDIEFRLGAWRVSFSDHGLNRRPEAQTLWGTNFYPFNRILQAAFNNLGITITYEDQDGVKHTDDARTAEVNEKRIRLREEFSTWAWKENKRRIELETNFNETMNAIADAKYDGSFLSMPGMSLTRGEDQLSLRKHQMDAIWRGIVNRRGIYAHEVGTGKTYTMGGIAVESRRLGMARKTLIFAHNANSKDVAASIQQMYPAAAVLYVDNLAPETINLTLQQIANDDWDAIVVPHSLVDRFALKEATLKEIAAEQIAQMEEEAILAAADDNVSLTVGMMDDPELMKRVRSPTAK